MNVIILRKNFADALSAVEKATGENLNLPILKHVLIKTEGTQLKLTATNLEIAVVAYAAAKVIENGEIAVPALKLKTIVSNLSSERLTLNQKNNTLHLSTDTYEATLQGLPVDEFPIIPQLKDDASWIECSALVLQEALSQVLPTIQVSDLRPEISGVLLVADKDALKFVGTDSFRLAEKTISSNQFTASLKEAVRVIIPLKAAQEVLRNLTEDTQVRIIIEESQVLFKTSNFSITSRLIDGVYPDYETILPKSSETEIEVQREEFMNALKLVSVFSDRANETKLSIKENKKTLEISSADPGFGENHYLLAIKTKGNPVSISFNWRYLFDGLKVIKDNFVFVSLNGDSKPAVIRPSQNQTFIYVLMPIKNI